MLAEQYRAQVRLLLRCVPSVAKETCFALKGGTAINLFVRDLPRLSVDIDLAYIPVESRDDSIINVEKSLKNISLDIKKTIKDAKINESKNGATGRVEKLFVSADGANIKIEPNPVIRGSVYDCAERSLVAKAQTEFELEASMSVVSLPDLYGGKLVAAMDRQHPRDLFDVKLLLKNEGITAEIRKAFIVYLASHSRPMHEVLNPTRHNHTKVFNQEFEGMTDATFTYADFENTREELIKTILADLTKDEKHFMVSIQEGNPNWKSLGIKGIETLPALTWKLQNVRKMKEEKRDEAIALLKKTLGI